MGKGHGAKSEAVREKFVKVVANPDYKTNKERIEAIDISGDTFYNWLRDPELKKRIEDLVGAFTDAELAAVWQALIDKCKAGDVQAIKLFFELKDKYVARTEQNGVININIKVEE